MKTYTKPREFETSGDAVGMVIDNDSVAKIINILVANMYSDKPKSIWREIIANGYDAQRDAGTGHIPMDVTMPSIWDSNFKFRDYGTGLSHEFMLNEYCRVGYSSKENTNNAVGKWGLGRLVPLSYTDTYTVISYQGGKARHYAVSRSPEGISCVFMGDQDTKEANGIEISFPIKREDADKFAAALKYISLGLDVKPRAVNQPDFKWPEAPTSIQGNGWRYLDTSKLEYGSPLKGQAHVRMGCVLYPINKEYDFAGDPVILEAPIGSLAVTASREALSYGPDEPTDKTIRRLLSKFAEEVVDEQVKKTLGSKTYTEALKHHMKTLVDLRGSFKSAYTKQVKHWKGYYLPEASYFYPDTDLIEWDNWAHSASKDKPRVQVTKAEATRALRWESIDKVHVVIENITESSRDIRGPKRILQWWRSFGDDNRPKAIAWVQVDENDKQCLQHLIEFFCKFPDWPVTLVADMPDIPKSVRVKNAVKAKRLSDRLGHSVYYSQEEVTISDFDQGGYYIKTDKNSLVGWQGREESFLYLLSTARKLKEIADNEVVYVAPKTLWPKFEGNPKWVEITHKIKPMVLKHKVGLIKCASEYLDCNKDVWLTRFRGCSKLIDSYLDGWDCTDKYMGVLSPGDCVSVLSYLDVGLPNVTKGAIKENLSKEIYKRYPLLVSKDYRLEQHYIHYIVLVEQSLMAKAKETENV